MANLKDIFQDYLTRTNENMEKNQPTALYASSKNLYHYLQTEKPSFNNKKINESISYITNRLNSMTIEPKSVIKNYKKSKEKIEIILKDLESKI